MKLTNVGLSPSKQHKNSNDVLVNSRSNVAVLQHLDFAFEERVTSICPVRTLREIVEDVREYQRVSIKCFCPCNHNVLVLALCSQQSYKQLIYASVYFRLL